MVPCLESSTENLDVTGTKIIKRFYGSARWLLVEVSRQNATQLGEND